MNSTSTSDNGSYPMVCRAAASEDSIFDNFKLYPQYRQILEHVSFEQGTKYYDEFKDIENLVSILDKFAINDTLGNPEIRDYPFGSFSPTTLRYIKVLSDFMKLCDLNDKDIVEIGCGYGGQYTVLRQLITPSSYTFIDIEDALMLTEKYISKLGYDDIEVNFKTSDNLEAGKYDLCISNYAISECIDSIQDIYIENILSGSKYGYITHNNQMGYSHEQLMEKLDKKFKIESETPQTGGENVIITWTP